MKGRVLQSVRVSHPRTSRRNASRQEMIERLEGRRVGAVGRHGKYLILELDEGFTMVAHLGMSGRFSVARHDEPMAPHTHFAAELDDGSEIRFIDPRTFGFIAAFDEDEMASQPLSRLGPDAWDEPPDVIELESSLRGRSAPIKALLLDQGPLAGLGNIYADEALHKAKIHPLVPGGELKTPKLAALLDAVYEVLNSAIDRGGTTLDDLAYLLPDGAAGENLDSLAVYGREGEPCQTCGTPVEKLILRQRSTHFCPVCQPL